jgi:hypothetical protein
MRELWGPVSIPILVLPHDCDVTEFSILEASGIASPLRGHDGDVTGLRRSSEGSRALQLFMIGRTGREDTELRLPTFERATHVTSKGQVRSKGLGIIRYDSARDFAFLNRLPYEVSLVRETRQTPFLAQSFFVCRQHVT